MNWSIVVRVSAGSNKSCPGLRQARGASGLAAGGPPVPLASFAHAREFSSCVIGIGTHFFRCEPGND